MSTTGEKKTIKNTNIWRLNNTLLNSQQITEEIKKEIKICIETNENENTTTQNLWDTVKAVLRGKFTAILAYLKKQEKSQINNLTLHLVKFSCSVMSDSLRPHELQHPGPPCSSPTPGVHSNSLSIESMMPSSHLILCCPLLLLSSIFPSIRVFSNESALRIRWPKYWSFSLSIIPSKEIPVLISFRMDWLDLLAVQGTLKSLLQHHSSKASIFRCTAFLTVQLSHPYMTTGNTIALTRRTFVGKVISLLLNVLSRLVITFLPRSKRLLISWLRSLYTYKCI